MGDLIWVGNTVLPRGTVVVVMAIILLIVAGALTWASCQLSSQQGNCK